MIKNLLTILLKFLGLRIAGKTNTEREDDMVILSSVFNQLKLREQATAYAMSFIGTPYMWGGNGPFFDCSGFACEIMKAFGKLKPTEDLSAEQLKSKFIMVNQPSEGCLVFFYNTAKTKITHVEYCINDILSIGASGGGSMTLSLPDALRDHAFVQIRPINRDRAIACYADPFKEVN